MKILKKKITVLLGLLVITHVTWERFLHFFNILPCSLIHLNNMSIIIFIKSSGLTTLQNKTLILIGRLGPFSSNDYLTAHEFFWKLELYKDNKDLFRITELLKKSYKYFTLRGVGL